MKIHIRKIVCIIMIVLINLNSAGIVYAQDVSVAPDAGNVYITNNVGQPDTILVTGLDGGDTVKVYKAATGDKLLGTVTLSSYSSEAVIKVAQLGISAGSVYISVKSIWELESRRIKVNFPAEPKTGAIAADNVYVTNNAGNPDTIHISGLYGGESINIYNAATGGRLLNSTSIPTSKTEADINVTQLGTAAGSIYIAITYKGEHESNRTKVNFPAEPRSMPPIADDIMINNNVGKPDTIYVYNLYGGELIRIYNAAAGGRQLGSVTASPTATEATANIVQLGTAAGSVYITITNKGEQESDRIKVDYSAEPKSDAVSTEGVEVSNFAGLSDTIYVNYLSVGDTVKVYDAPKGGSILGTATVASSKTDVTISVMQLGKQSGSVYISIASKGMLESDRKKFNYPAEAKSIAPETDQITIANNGGTSDAITVTGLGANDAIKVYDSYSNGNLLGSATVAATKNEATVSIPQLGSSTGSVYVSVTGKGCYESDKTEVIFSAEAKTSMPSPGDIMITNSSGKADIVYVTDLTAGDMVRVYDSAAGGKLLGSATVAAAKTDASISIAQLGTAAGKVYISVTSTNKLESGRTAATYVSEPVTDVVDAYVIEVTNNPTGKSDAVHVYNLFAGDVVRVYDSETGGNLLGSAAASSATSEAIVNIAQLGTDAGDVYITVASSNKLESKRVKAAYSAESKSDEISSDSVNIHNNKSGTADTIEVTGLNEGDVVKVYSAALGGKLLGTATVKTYESYATVTITQLGAAAGSVYVSVTGANKLESGKIKVDYPAESKSGTISADDITVYNNAAGTPDTVEVTGLAEGDAVKVYDSAKGGNILGTATVAEYGSYTKVSIAQLGAAAGSVYITVTNKNKIESDRVKADYLAESKSDVTGSDDIIVSNNAGTDDTVQVDNLDTGDTVKVYDAARGGNLLGSGTAAAGSNVAISIAQLGRTAGSIYVTITKKNKVESDRIKVDYLAEDKSSPPAADDISIINNYGAPDIIKVGNLTYGDVVRIYDSEKVGNLLGTTTVSDYDSYAVVEITQLGAPAGNVYVSVINKRKQESDRIKAAYSAEPKSGLIDSGNIIISNNAGALDTVLITGLAGGDSVNVYAAAKGGNLLGTATVSDYDSYAVVEITQLGTLAGNIYVSVTCKGKLEGDRTTVAYAAEQKSNPPAASNITVTNNAGIADTITVNYLKEGDFVKIYDSATEGTLLGSGNVPSDSTEITVEITQLGSAAGTVYVSVTSENKLESGRTVAYYTEEATTDAPEYSNIKISNNVKIADTVTVAFLEPEDVVKIYNEAAGGSILGSATVPSDTTQVTVSIQQLGSSAGSVYVSVTSKGKKESSRTVAKYSEEQKSDTVSSSNVIVVNNAGMSDTVTVTYLDAGDVIKVYDAAVGGNLLGLATVASGSKEAAIKINQLGYYAGYVYITVTDYGRLESDRLKAYYTAEPVSDAPAAVNIKVTNNSGKSDTVYVTGLIEYDVVKVYDSAAGGSLLGTATVAADSNVVTVRITQLGTSSGAIYISVTSKGATESSRTRVDYGAEN